MATLLFFKTQVFLKTSQPEKGLSSMTISIDKPYQLQCFALQDPYNWFSWHKFAFYGTYLPSIAHICLRHIIVFYDIYLPLNAHIRFLRYIFVFTTQILLLRHIHLSRHTYLPPTAHIHLLRYIFDFHNTHLSWLISASHDSPSSLNGKN